MHRNLLEVDWPLSSWIIKVEVAFELGFYIELPSVLKSKVKPALVDP